VELDTRKKSIYCEPPTVFDPDTYIATSDDPVIRLNELDNLLNDPVNVLNDPVSIFDELTKVSNQFNDPEYPLKDPERDPDTEPDNEPVNEPDDEPVIISDPLIITIPKLAVASE
jgi:hypothetical protein